MAKKARKTPTTLRKKKLAKPRRGKIASRRGSDAERVEKTCFVIMPFGTKPDVDGEDISFDGVYRSLIQNAVALLNKDPEWQRQFRLKCTRCDEIAQAGWIHRDMVEHIVHSDVAIVDITTLNANVFYELGVRHALRRGVTVLIRHKNTKTPFNIQGQRIVTYDLSYDGTIAAQEEIKTFIKNGLSNPKPDSLVHEVFPGLTVTA